MSDVCHNLLGLHTNVKQDTAGTHTGGESQESREFPRLEDTQVLKEIFCTSISLQRKSYYQHQLNWTTKTSQNILSISHPLYDLFPALKYFEDILHLAWMAVSGCHMTQPSDYRHV